MKIKLVIFDLDGTLVDTAADITAALNYAVQPYLNKSLTVTETIGLIGEGITRLIDKLIGEERTGIRPAVQERFISYYSEHLSDCSKAYPGVVETLEELGDYKKAIVSNKRELLSRGLLDDLGLIEYFDLVLGSDSAGEKKPSPKPLFKAMDIFSCKPSETVIVGDSNYDIQAGKAAGVNTVAVSYGYRDVRLLKDADFLIDDINELKSILGQLNVG
jgi:phosphoglycolate phosphatase